MFVFEDRQYLDCLTRFKVFASSCELIHLFLSVQRLFFQPPFHFRPKQLHLTLFDFKILLGFSARRTHENCCWSWHADRLTPG